MRELLLVIGRPADIRVAGTRGGRWGIGLERHAIETVLEHRLDVAIRPGADGDRPTAGGLDTVGAVLLREPQQAETGPIALLRVRPARENLLDERRGVRPHRGPPADQAGGTPLQMRAVRVGHVLGDRGEAAGMMTAAMHPDPRAALKYFEGRGRESKIDGLMNEPMGHGVEMPLDVDVIVDVHARLAPLGVDEALGRQRPKRRLIETREEIPAGGPAVP